MEGMHQLISSIHKNAMSMDGMRFLICHIHEKAVFYGWDAVFC